MNDFIYCILNWNGLTAQIDLIGMTSTTSPFDIMLARSSSMRLATIASASFSAAWLI